MPTLSAELLDVLLPLGDPLVTGLVTILTIILTRIFTRREQKAKVDNLQAEKKSIEAASGVSAAEAAQIISQAAAETVRPLLDRIRELREENADQDIQILNLKTALDKERQFHARYQAENKLLREHLKMQGLNIPELPPEVNKNDSLF